MLRPATSLRRARADRRRRGSALLGSLLFGIAIVGLILVTTSIARVEVNDSRRAIDELRARLLAESGAEVGILFLDDAAGLSTHDPIGGIAGLFAGGDTIWPNVASPVMNGAAQIGSYTTTLTLVDRTATSISIRCDATGYTPKSPSELLPGERVKASKALSVTVRFSVEASEVFDYAYFINNWGWFYGNTIYCNGNARSNGQFDAAGYKPTITGQPLYDQVDWDGVNASLSGYRDDNEDGLEDGNDGGVFAGWDVVGGHNIKGQGGSSDNQHDFVDQVTMPNLSDLSSYEAQALSEGGSISIGGVEMSDAIYGDDAGELGNLYLVGTINDPIEIDGPVVVRGNVIISGYVKGQGAIYTEGNTYVPESVEYVNPPTTLRPTDNTRASTEAWLSKNWNADFLGLFAKENIIVGDYTHSTWRHYVSSWLASPLNGSAEDAGEDRIPNTKAGRDGILGTADDDVLEGDGIFTTEYYTADDLALGLIPPDKSVGDPIPDTGEDIDGDGVFDGTIDLNEVDIKIPLDTANWGGNMPAGGIAKYSNISSLYASTLDAVFYTNHAFCYVVFGGTAARINGAVVSRNESIVYGTPYIELNYDCRILGGTSGMAGQLLPQTLGEPEILRWSALEGDPNRYVKP